MKVEGKQGDAIWVKELDLSLESREFSVKEKAKLDEKTESFLRKKLPGKNPSLKRVEESLVFPATLPGTGMKITWTVDET